MTTRTQKTTKVSESERIEAMQDLKTELRNLDPNISATELERRAAIATGLAKEGDQPTAEDIAEATTSRTKKAAQKTKQVAGKVPKPRMPTGKAQRIIFGIMILVVGIQIFNDIIKGRNRQFDVIPRRIFAGSLAGILLMLLAAVLPRVAIGIATLMGISVLLIDSRASETLGQLTSVARGNASPTPSPNGGGKQGAVPSGGPS